MGALLNRYCVPEANLESIFRRRMPKILLQHNRSKSGHAANGREVPIAAASRCSNLRHPKVALRTCVIARSVVLQSSKLNTSLASRVLAIRRRPAILHYTPRRIRSSF